MVKRVIVGFLLTTVVLILCAFGLKTFLVSSGKEEEKILNNALTLGDTLIDMYREDVTSSSLQLFKDEDKYSKDVITAINDHQAYLTSLDDEVFDLSEYYYETFEVYEEVPTDIDEYLENNPDGVLFEVAEDETTPTTVDTEDYDNTDIEDSSFIYYKDDTAYVNVKDFSFQDGVATVTYSGRTFDILQVNIPQTYTAIKNDTKYLYSYTDYMFSKDTEDFVDLQYTSVTDKEEVKIIRVYHNKRGTITGFTVR